MVGSRLIKAAQASPTPVGPTKEKQLVIRRSCLNPSNSYLLDTGFHVYIWIGGKSSPSIRSNSVSHAHSYFKSYRRPVLPLTIIKEKQETDGFQKLFVDTSAGCQCVIS
jgi:hypothetical protein